MSKHIVGTVSELPPGEKKIVSVEGRSIGVYNVGGAYYAIRNRCAHQGGPLCEGVQAGFLTSEGPGQYSYTRKGEIVRCPWHGWEFDLKTGLSWWDPAKTRAQSYGVDVVSGEEVTGPQKGPYVVDTYDVSVDEEYIVLEF